MVHGGDHGLDYLAVGKGQHGDLGAFKEFLDDDVLAALAEDFVSHHGLHRVHGLLPGLGDDDALSQGQAVGLDDGGDGGVLQVFEGRVHAVEDLIGGGGDAVFLH